MLGTKIVISNFKEMKIKEIFIETKTKIHSLEGEK